MTAIFRKIQELEELNHLSKHEQLVNGIINAIEDKILVKGSMLPSVNNMVRELGFARKTIVKAYSDLKDRGIVESKNRLGYYVANEATDQRMKVALILYAFQTFQENFYNNFRASLGENIQLDVFFHHTNMEVFKSIFSNIADRYAMYVVAPIQNEQSIELLSTIPPNKLLIVDRHLKMDEPYSFITQEFESPFYDTLLELSDTIRQFSNCVLLFRPNYDNPYGILRAYQAFLKHANLIGTVESHYQAGSLKKNTVYLVQNDSDLWQLLKDCRQAEVQMGKEVGILSFNESIVKEIVFGGITTLSTDFAVMAQKAADFVLNKENCQEIIPTKLIRRASL